MENRFYTKHNLLDKKIVTALEQAKKDYQNGAIIEVRDTLFEIVEALNEFERDN